MRRIIAVLGCVFLGITVGCATSGRQRVATYISPTLGANMPARIVVVPFDGRSCTADARNLVTESVALELQSVLLCDIVPAPTSDERLMAEIGLWKRGRIDVDALVTARKTYSADAFLFGTLTQYKEYDPPLIGLKLRMLDARTGDMMWAAEAVFDGRDKDVRRRAVASFKKSGLKKTLYGPPLVFMSPRLFSRFVAQEVVRPLGERAAEPDGRRLAGR